MSEKWRRECRLPIPKGLRPSAQGWAASAYPGCAFGTGNNANGVAAHSPTLRQRRYVGLRIKRIQQPQTRLWPFVREWDGGNGRNRVAVEIFVWTVTQGSAFRATLGFGSESRWDSPNAQFKNRSSQSSGTRNFGGH